MEKLIDHIVGPLLYWVPLLADYRWQLNVIVLLFLTAVFAIAFSSVLKRVINSLRNTTPLWDDLILDALRKPGVVMIWVMGVTGCMKVIAPTLDKANDALPEQIREVALVFVVGWSALRFVSRFEHVLLHDNERMDATTADAISKLLRLIIIVLSTLVMLQTIGYSISGLLAFGGIGGIAVGFAAKDLLANFFGGLMIYLDRPFQVGDWIRSPDASIEGTVEKIGWRLTMIRTFDQRPLYVPNATFTSIAVENPSRMKARRIYEYIGVRYDDAEKLQGVVDKIHTMMVEHPEIDENNTLFVNFNRFGPSSLDIMIYAFTHTTNWGKYLDVREDVFLKIIDIIDDAGAEIAFPTTTVHMANPAAGPVIAGTEQSIQAAQPHA